MPKVSVIMSVFNGEEYVSRAVDSVVGQTFGDWEMIITDDGSTDRTVEILQGCSDPRVKVFSIGRQGRSRALNAAATRASGEYIANLDADDWCLPERLERQVQVLDESATVALVGTGSRMIYPDGEEADVPCHSDDETIRRFLRIGSPFAHSSVMFRRDAFGQVGAYTEDLRVCVDYDLFLRLARDHALAGIPEPLIARRVHGSNYFMKHISRWRYHRTLCSLRWKHLPAVSPTPWWWAYAMLPVASMFIPKRLLSGLRKRSGL